MKVLDYEVVEASDSEVFTALCKKMIDRGFETFGAMASFQFGKDVRLFQVWVIPAPKPPRVEKPDKPLTRWVKEATGGHWERVEDHKGQVSSQSAV